MYRSIALLLGLTLAATAAARDSTPAPPLTEADRDTLARIVVDTWAPHVDAQHLDRWLAHVGERADNAPLAWLETAAAALDLRSAELALDGAAPLDMPAPTAFGDAGGNLVFTPVPPCRLLDTRVASPRGGVIPDNSERSFFGFNANFQSAQGGANSQCGLPLATRPEALAITLVSVNPSGDGFLTAYPVGSTRPLAASLNYSGNAIDSTGFIVPINNATSVDEFTIYTWRATHVVADVTGYFSRPQAAALDCITLDGPSISVAPGQVEYATSPMCPANYTSFLGSCFAGTINAVLITAELVGQRTGCLYRSNAAGNFPVSASAKCCRIGGR